MQPQEQPQQNKKPSKVAKFFAGLCGAMCVNYTTDGIAGQLQSQGLLHGDDVYRFQGQLKREAEHTILDHYQNPSNEISLQGQHGNVPDHH